VPLLIALFPLLLGCHSYRWTLREDLRPDRRARVSLRAPANLTGRLATGDTIRYGSASRVWGTIVRVSSDSVWIRTGTVVRQAQVVPLGSMPQAEVGIALGDAEVSLRRHDAGRTALLAIVGGAALAVVLLFATNARLGTFEEPP